MSPQVGLLRQVLSQHVVRQDSLLFRQLLLSQQIHSSPPELATIHHSFNQSLHRHHNKVCEEANPHFLANTISKRDLYGSNFNRIINSRQLSTSGCCHNENTAASGEEEQEIEDEDGDGENENNSEDEFLQKYHDPKDRSRVISPELSMKYMESVAYQATYGSEPVWKYYRRNFAGGRVPKTRETCIRQERVTTSSPCPICRDEYLIVNYRNVKLLHQFIDSYSGALIDPFTTGVCQYQWRRLQLHIEMAKDHGLLDIDTYQIKYDLSLYKPK